MRIYEINEHYHIDLAKVVTIKQCIDHPKKRSRLNSSYECWIEIHTDHGEMVEIECAPEEIEETYRMLLKAWCHQVGDYDESEQKKMYEDQIEELKGQIAYMQELLVPYLDPSYNQSCGQNYDQSYYENPQ